MNRGPNHNRNTTALAAEYVAAIKAIRRVNSEEKTMAILGVGVGTLDKALTSGRLTAVAVDRLVMRLDALAALK